jgi:outer membrane OprD family porin
MGMRRCIRIILAAIAISTSMAVPALAQKSGEPFTDDAKAGAVLRSLYFRRDLPASIQESWALGGSIWGRTGYWRDFLQFGGTIYGSGALYGPDNRDGTLSLKPGQDSFAVIGEAYARLKGWDQTLTLYRQAIGNNPQKAEGVRGIQTDMSYLGSRDIRMVPLTYEAVMLGGQITDTLRYQAGYVDKVKDINSDKFVSMSRLAGVTTRNEGMWTGGLQWQPVKDLWLQGSYYQVDDTIRISYADVDWVNRISKESYWRLAAQYTNQRSEGANLLTGSSFKTWNGGLYGEYGWNWLTLYGAAGTTGEGAAIRNPYSYGPFYISQRIKVFSRAGEDALMLGSSFNLAPLGMTGFSFDFNIADGRHAIDAATRASLPKWREYDFDFIYRFPKESAVPGMRLRARWGTVREEFATRTDRTDDLRLDLNWAVNFN